jgi:hypothetical protein
MDQIGTRPDRGGEAYAGFVKEALFSKKRADFLELVGVAKQRIKVCQLADGNAFFNGDGDHKSSPDKLWRNPSGIRRDIPSVPVMVQSSKGPPLLSRKGLLGHSLAIAQLRRAKPFMGRAALWPSKKSKHIAVFVFPTAD